MENLHKDNAGSGSLWFPMLLRFAKKRKLRYFKGERILFLDDYGISDGFLYGEDKKHI